MSESPTMRNNMISAVILVNTEMDSQDQVLKSVRAIEGVQEAHALYGVYDLIVKIQTSSIEKIKDINKYGIKQVEGVTSSLTLMLIDQPIKSMRNMHSSSAFFEPTIEVQHPITPIQEF
jgi:DNA-binding Lrp family transcriptional regulator